MKVALAHDHLNQIGGAEAVLSALHGLYAQAPVFTLLHDRVATGAAFQDWDVRESFIRNLPGGERFFKWYLWLMPTAVERFNLTDYDLVISSSSALIKGLVVKPSTKHLCYCHSPTRYLWSDTHQYTEELPQPRIVKKVVPLLLTYLRMWDYAAAQRVDEFAANSEFVRQRIHKYYRRDATVIYPPVDVSGFGPPQEPGDYFLILSRLRPYKRVDLAIRAFNKLGMKLIVAGSGEQESELRRLAKPNVEFVGHVSEEEKRKLMARCRAFIYPQEEDFGITAVEAMAAGRPVIAYQAGGALETVQSGKTGTFFQEQSWEALADAVIRFRYQEFQPETIQRHAQKFSHERFTRQWQEFVSRVTGRS